MRLKREISNKSNVAADHSRQLCGNLSDMDTVDGLHCSAYFTEDLSYLWIPSYHAHEWWYVSVVVYTRLFEGLWLKLFPDD